MNEKLSLQDLVDLLSKKAKITKKEADSFYRELFQLVLERIFDNDLVKIKDFGTFKLVSVSSRESVNVNTGEKIEIPSHYKLSFIPDKILKNLVNKPFSQFETIMLEDGVIFEASVDNAKDASEEEFTEKTELDTKDNDDDIVRETEKNIEEESVSVNSNIKLEVKKENTQDTKSSNISKPKNSTNQAYPRSFVYSYTTSGSEDKSGSITLTIPKNDLQGAVHTPKVEKEVISEEIQTKTEFPIELKDLPLIKDNAGDDLDEEIVNSIEENIEDIVFSSEENELIDEYQTLDESESVEEIDGLEPDKENKEEEITVSLSEETISDDIELESDFHSELETEEDVIIPVPIVEEVEKNEQVEESVVEKIKEKDSRVVFSNEDPERPLFPTEDDQVVDDLNFAPLDEVKAEELETGDREASESESHNIHSYAGNNKPIETRSVLFSDTIDPVNIPPYADYGNQRPRSKFRKWLPAILFISVIVGFLAYGLVKMLRKPYDFEYNLGRTNLSLSDTLPLVEEASPQVQETDALLDSMKRVQSVLAEDTVQPTKQEPIVPIAQVPAVKQEVEPVKAAIAGNADSITTELIDSEKNNFVISDKLKFGILNKAEYHLSKYAGSGVKGREASSEPSDIKEATASKPQYATIKRGTTLRTISAAHYGSPDYWVYIYEANKRNISNPNNVPIGTTLLIPSLSGYGVSNPKSSTAIQAAKNLESKILRQR